MASPLIYRKRLISAINTPGHHIIYIFGPAGFGKSTLARDWMQSQTLPTVWVEGYSTSNATELFTLFVNAISETVPGLKSKLVKFQKVEKVSLQDILSLEEMLEKDKTPFNIVIDNAEEIRREHNELSLAIVRHMPKHIKLILVTTTSPRSEFIREAGINRFAVVGPEDLRFNTEEIKQLAQESLADISNHEIELIQDLTQGWPASTEIVASLLKANPEFRNQLSSLKLKGKHQFAVEANRVLSKLDSTQRELLKKLSPLTEITPDVAFEITQNIDVVRQLTMLSQDSIIVTQIDQMPPRFKIHPIFRDVLIDEMRREPQFNKEIEEIIQFLLENKQVRQATSILIEMGETQRLSKMLQDPKLISTIGTSIQESIVTMSINELRQWLVVSDFLPKTGPLGKALINFYISLLSGDIKSADGQIKLIETMLPELDKEFSDSWRADLLALQSLSAFAKGQLNLNWQLAMSAYELQRSSKASQGRHQLTYLQVALWGAFVIDEFSRIKQISEILDEVATTRSTPHHNSTVAAMRCLIAANEGRLTETKNYLVAPFNSQTNSEPSGFFGAFGSRFAESIILGEQAKFAESMELLQHNADQALAGFNFPIAIAALGRLAYHQILLRDSESAYANIDKARDLIRQHSLSEELHAIIDIWEIRVRHFMLDNERVQDLLKRCPSSYFVQSFQAAAYIGAGNLDAAGKLIDTFDLSIPRQAITHYLFKAFLLKDSQAAQLKAIAKAVEYGSKHGYFHHFVTQRSDILQQYISLASDSPTAFNERLARAAGEELNKMMVTKGENGDALTRREADILRHLATGLPLKEIASNLSISKNTIKTHLRNLYRKLGAEDRDDAVEKGKKLLKL